MNVESAKRPSKYMATSETTSKDVTTQDVDIHGDKYKTYSNMYTHNTIDRRTILYELYSNSLKYAYILCIIIFHIMLCIYIYL